MSKKELRELFLEYFAEWCLLDEIPTNVHDSLSPEEMLYLVSLKRAARMAVIEHD